MQNCALSQKAPCMQLSGLMMKSLKKFADAKGYVTAANYNCPMQLVIAGDEDSAEKAANECIKKGGKSGKAAGQRAFTQNTCSRRHSSFMNI